MKAKAVLSFEPSGQGSGVYTELIDLHSIGSLHVRRESFIEFNNERQVWEVKNALGAIVFFAKARGACLAWEQTGDLGLNPEQEAA